jgi:hypothetical protein
MENFKTDTSGNSRDTSGTSSDALFLLEENDVDGPGQGHARLVRGYPPYSEDMAMRLSCSFSRLAVAVSSLALLLSGLSCAAMAATDPSGSSSLPSITVQAPRHVARPYRTVPRAVARPAAAARRTVSRETSSPAEATQPGGQGSIMERLKRLERTSSNCTDGCQTSFRYGNQPWNGCNGSGGNFIFSTTCRNVRNFKTYQECREHGLFLAARNYEVWWYCQSLVSSGKLSGEKVQVAETKRPAR